MTVRRSVVRGVGAYLPARVMTNDELSRKVATDDAWIRQRTGIRERHIAAEGEYTSHLGIAAARVALANAKMGAEAIDLIVLATSTPDQTFPATAVAIQAELGILKGAAFDVQASTTPATSTNSRSLNRSRAGRSESLWRSRTWTHWCGKGRRSTAMRHATRPPSIRPPRSSPCCPRRCPPILRR